MKLIFKSLISNEAVITGSRKHKWWVALLILLFSLIVAIVPTFVQTISVQGDSIFSNGSYGLDLASVEFLDECDQNGYKLYIKDHELNVEGWSVGTPIDYIPDGETDPDTSFMYVTGSALDVNATISGYNYSVIVFGKTDFLIHVVNPNTKSVVKSQYYENAYKDYKDVELVSSLLKKSNDKVNVNSTWNNVKGFYKNAYNYSRVVSAFGQAGLTAAIDVVVAFLMGLMVFILTRGKANIFREFTFWEGQKIAYWSAITPAILGLIFGFLIPAFAVMSFVLFYGIRVMWLTMKQLRPDGSGYVIPKQEVKTVNVKSK